MLNTFFKAIACLYFFDSCLTREADKNCSIFALHTALVLLLQQLKAFELGLHDVEILRMCCRYRSQYTFDYMVTSLSRIAHYGKLPLSPLIAIYDNISITLWLHVDDAFSTALKCLLHITRPLGLARWKTNLLVYNVDVRCRTYGTFY